MLEKFKELEVMIVNHPTKPDIDFVRVKDLQEIFTLCGVDEVMTDEQKHQFGLNLDECAFVEVGGYEVIQLSYSENK